MKKLTFIFLFFPLAAFAADPVQLPAGCGKPFHKCEGWEFTYPPTPDKNGKTDFRGEHKIFIPNNDKVTASRLADKWAAEHIYK